jgi:DNA ligase D-like protein (predicted polymerase)
MPGAKAEVVEVAGREVTVTNPDKVFFPRDGRTKIDLVRYYLSVADGALRGVADRPMALKRFVNGAEGQAFFQKRAPDKRPDYIGTVELKFPSGRTASEIVVDDAAALAWVVNLGCIDLNPHPIRAGDLDHPDELRVDLDPVPGVEWAQIMDVALVAQAVLADFGLTGWPKTSGSRGFHIYARIEQNWPFTEVRRAAVAMAREIERRAPEIATSKWWKEERHGVFVDYNQNAKDRTIASAYSVRPTPDARVSTPLNWDEVAGCDPAAFTMDTVPERFAALGDPWAGMDEAVGSIAALLELADRDEAAGLPDAPWPPHFVRQAGEEPRVQPSKRRSGGGAKSGRAGSRGAKAAVGGDEASEAGEVSGAEEAGGAAVAGELSVADGADGATATGSATAADGTTQAGRTPNPTGRRKSKMPLIEIARAETKDEAMAGFERWKERHPTVWPHLAPRDVLVDSMRGRSSTWTRIRVNLQHVPDDERPEQEPLEVDYDPWRGFDPRTGRPSDPSST